MTSSPYPFILNPPFIALRSSPPLPSQPYVQDVFAGSILTPSSAGVMVVGQKEMFESVKSHCEDVGVGEGRGFSNF